MTRGHPKTVGISTREKHGEWRGLYRKSRPTGGALPKFTRRGSDIRLAMAWREWDRSGR